MNKSHRTLGLTRTLSQLWGQLAQEESATSRNARAQNCDQEGHIDYQFEAERRNM